jgi:hypothetical protein
VTIAIPGAHTPAPVTGEPCADDGNTSADVAMRQAAAQAVDTLVQTALAANGTDEDAESGGESQLDDRGAVTHSSDGACGASIDDCVPEASRGAAAVNSDSLQENLGTTTIKVILDLFHAMDRLIKLAHKKHGGYRPFISRLREAFTVFRPCDVAAAIGVYAAKHGLSGSDLDKAAQRDYAAITQHCPVAVPSDSTVLLYRFDQVILTFCNVVDANTGDSEVARDKFAMHCAFDCPGGHAHCSCNLLLVCAALATFANNHDCTFLTV